MMGYIGHCSWFHAANAWLEQEEHRALELAMSSSLNESEEEKAKQKPVAEMTQEELLNRFFKSAILPEVTIKSHNMPQDPQGRWGVCRQGVPVCM